MAGFTFPAASCSSAAVSVLERLKPDGFKQKQTRWNYVCLFLLNVQMTQPGCTPQDAAESHDPLQSAAFCLSSPSQLLLKGVAQHFGKMDAPLLSVKHTTATS